MIAPCLLMLSLLASPEDPLPAKFAVRNELLAKIPAIEVVGIDPANLKKLAEVDWDAGRWSELFTVGFADGQHFTGAPPTIQQIPGSYRVVGNTLRFEPKFPLDPDLVHDAHFRPTKLPIPVSGQPALLGIVGPKAKHREPVFVARVDPSGEEVPENLLKFYIQFSGYSMSRGEVYKRVSLLDEAGRRLEMPFLELGEELWDASGTRVTLLLDPGRVKRGLKPREEEGPILEAGKKYTLVVDQKWPDSNGNPLKEAFRKPFKVGPPVESRVDVQSWKITPPKAGSNDPLMITFPRPLDRALLDRCLVVHRPDGFPIEGVVSIDLGDTRWQFKHVVPWPAGEWSVHVDPLLEDLAGNNLIRPFEVDVERPIGEKDPKPIVLPFRVESPGRK